MLYIIGTVEEYEDEDSYIFFETGTDSFFKGDDEFLQDLISINEIEIKNIVLHGRKYQPKPWPNKMYCKRILDMDSGEPYILLCQLGADNFKLVSCAEEAIRYMSSKYLKDYTNANKIANCFRGSQGKYESIDTYNAIKNTEFEEDIGKKYKRYEAISAMLGHKASFKYTIEGREVKLVKYTGIAKEVIIPNFITSIMTEAFYSSGIEELTLNQGLKSIGRAAFGDCKLSNIIIPETVEFIGEQAFFGNRRIGTLNGQYTKGIEILNKKTVVLDNILNEPY